MNIRGLTGPTVRFLTRHRGLIKAVLASAALVAGLALAFLSFIPEIKVVGSETLEGNLPASSRTNLSFVRAADLIELRLDVGNCSVFATALDAAQSDSYDASGVLPSAQLGCGTRSVGFSSPLCAIVVENRGSRSEPFAITARFFTVRATQAYTAVPALPLVLAGGTYLAFRGLHRGVQRIREDLLLEMKKR